MNARLFPDGVCKAAHSRATFRHDRDSHRQRPGKRTGSSDAAPTALRLEVRGQQMQSRQEQQLEERTSRVVSLLQLFNEQSEHLEQEVQRAKAEELRNKAASMQQLSSTNLYNDYKTKLDAIPISIDTSTGVRGQNLLPLSSGFNAHSRIGSGGPSTNISRDGISKRLIAEPEVTVSGALDSYISRDGFSKMPVTFPDVTAPGAHAEALSRSHDLLEHMQSIVDEKCQQQRRLIEDLIRGELLII